jgi:hypothetical protein
VGQFMVLQASSKDIFATATNSINQTNTAGGMCNQSVYLS